MSAEVDELIRAPQFQMTFSEKQQRLLPLLKQQSTVCFDMLLSYNKYAQQMRFPFESAVAYEVIPYLPAAMFKQFDLRTVNRLVR